MPSFVVEWIIDVDAENPRAAAEEALRIIKRPGSTANVFDVTGEDGETRRVDLQEIWEAEAVDAARKEYRDA